MNCPMAEMKHCSVCLMPDTRPRIVFTGDGTSGAPLVCNACLWAEERKGIDYGKRNREFHEIVQRSRSTGHPTYDCIVPFSGGKDSATIAWKLKHEQGLNPLLVCYGQLLWTDVGRRNFHRVADAGFDTLYWRVDQRVSRSLARRFFIERGHIKQHYDAAVNAVPLITAVNFGIPLVFFAEHGETEYGGLVLDEESRRTRNLTEVLENQVGDDARNWATDGLTERDLYPYVYPDAQDIERTGVRAFYYSYFFPWDIYENAKFTRERMGFEQAGHYKAIVTTEKYLHYGRERRRSVSTPLRALYENPATQWWGKSDGSFEGFDSIDDKCDDLYLYMMYRKFGFGRASRMASRLIQRGHMTREHGLELALRYDGAAPMSYIDDVAEYLGMTVDEIWATCDSHTNTALFDRTDDGWKLKSPPK